MCVDHHGNDDGNESKVKITQVEDGKRRMAFFSQSHVHSHRPFLHNTFVMLKKDKFFFFSGSRL